MADLLDRFALRDALYEADAVTMQGVKIINQFTAVDAVKVVRCKDCKYGLKSHLHKSHGELYLCRRENEYWKPNDFCSYGERKEYG